MTPRATRLAAVQAWHDANTAGLPLAEKQARWRRVEEAVAVEFPAAPACLGCADTDAGPACRAALGGECFGGTT